MERFNASRDAGPLTEELPVNLLTRWLDLVGRVSKQFVRETREQGLPDDPLVS
jgi:hypothetical protein